MQKCNQKSWLTLQKNLHCSYATSRHIVTKDSLSVAEDVVQGLSRKQYDKRLDFTC